MKVENKYWEFLKRRFTEAIFVSALLGGIGYLLYDYVFRPFFNLPSLWSSWFIMDKKAFLFAFISFSLPSLLIILTTHFYIKGKKDFFFQVGEWEKPLTLGKPKRLWLFKDTHGILSMTEKEFIEILFNGNPKRYALILGFFNGEIIQTDKIKFPLKEVNKAIEDYTNQLVKWGYATFKLNPQDEKLFRASLYFSLMHYVASLYGNIPASFLSPLIVNDVVNDFKSWYYYRKLIVVPQNVPIKLKQRYQKVRNFLSILHTFPKDILEELKLKFSPLSFEKNSAIEFEEEKWQNALTQTIPEEEKS
jgi:hypothetical protein